MSGDKTPIEPIAGDDASRNTSESGVVLNLKRIVEMLKSVKELMLVAAFFGGAIVWTIHYYATHDELESLECQMKLNVLLLQATSDKNYNEQLAKQARSSIRAEERTLRSAETSSDDDDIRSSQTRLDDLKIQVAGFQHAIEEQQKTSKKALDALTQHACLVKEQRVKILEKLRLGEF